MPEKMNDLFMYITDENGKDIKGESSLKVSTDKSFETMMGDFKSADYSRYSNFFDVTQFDFNMEMDDSDKSGGASEGFGGSHADFYMHPNPLDFAKKNQNQHQLKKITGNFSKVVDSASPIFFQNCCYKRPFTRAVLVKRAFTGLPVPKGESSAAGYLQIEMENITVTGVSWTDGDVVEEKIKFKCQHMEIYYRRQHNDGSLDTQVPLLNWTWSTIADKTDSTC